MPGYAEKLDEGLLWALLLVFCAFVLGLWGPPLFDLDEGAFTAATSEMLRRGDYITTWLNGEPRFDKPILIYWLQSLSVALGGRDEFFFRLPSALAACAWGLSLFYFAKARLGEGRAQLAIVFFCSCLTVVIIGRAATADALLNLLIALTMLDAWRFVETRSSKVVYRAYLWIGLGLLTKGPVAAVIPLVTLSVYCLIQRDFVLWKGVALRPLGWLVTLVIAAPWYVLEYLAQGEAFIQRFIFEHNLGRFSDTMESHGGSIFYYLPVLLMMFLPFSAWFIAGLGSMRKLKDEPLLLWCWVWFVFVVVFFSLSGTQLPHYILYGSTPVFFMMASQSERLKSIWWALVPAVILMICWLAVPSVIQLLLEQEQDLYILAMLSRAPEVVSAGYYAPLSIALLVLLSLPFLPLQRVRRLYLLGLTHILVLALVVIPLVAELKQQPVKNAAQYARNFNEPVLMWRHDMPSFSTYLNETTLKAEPLPGNLIFTREGKLLDQEAEILFSEGGILLARVVTPSEL
jgi:4-amino-4-deoxy-L-arabinose transferase-like glycosyltransferase